MNGDHLLYSWALYKSGLPSSPVWPQLLPSLSSCSLVVSHKDDIQGKVPGDKRQISNGDLSADEVLLSFQGAVNGGDGSLDECLEVLRRLGVLEDVLSDQALVASY